MTPAQIAQIRESWNQIQPVAGNVAQLFYGKLLELDPTLKPMFANDMNERGEKLIKVMTIAVNSLDRMATIKPTVREIGKRHVGYGIKQHHYNTVAAAFLWTLEQALGARFTSEVRDAWIEMYNAISTTMKEGADSTHTNPASYIDNTAEHSWRTSGTIHRLSAWINGCAPIVDCSQVLKLVPTHP